MKQLQCGFSQINITPTHPNEVFLDGYGTRILPAQGVRDRIYAKVCLIKWEYKEFALISLDICGLNNVLKNHLCDFISLMANIKREDFALCVTHTHAGPACGVLANLPINMMYWNRVAAKISQAIEQARDSVKAGSFRFTMAEEFTLPINRRGKEEINRNIWVCGFFDDENTLQGVLTAASCHAVCNTEYTISADFPGVLTRKAAKEYKGVPFLFLQSRGADINPPFGGNEGIQKVGNELGERVLKAVSQMKNAKPLQGELKTAFTRVQVPMTYLPKEELAKQIAFYQGQLQKAKSDPKRRYPEVELEWHLTALKEVEAGNTEPTIPVDLQVLTLGKKAVFAFVPFEVLTSTGNALEQKLCSLGFAKEQCFVVGYANGTNGYLCPAAESGQYGYETRLAAHWYMLPECCGQTEPTVINTLVDLAKSLLQTN